MYSVYLISAEINGEKCYKIGYTKRNVEDRIREFKTGNASEFEIVDSFQSEWGTRIETLLHRYYKSKKVNGEWFNLNEQDVSEFKDYCQRTHNNFITMVSSNTYIMDRIEKGKRKII